MFIHNLQFIFQITTIESRGASVKVCGTGPGSCCAGSNEGCPPEAPVCSEYGYCQCASYKPGGPACGTNYIERQPKKGKQEGLGIFIDNMGLPVWDKTSTIASIGQNPKPMEQNLKPVGQVCGTGQGSCCAGSNEGCPPQAPICSEYGYCQCASYKPGGPACGPGVGQMPIRQQVNGTPIGQNSQPMGQPVTGTPVGQNSQSLGQQVAGTPVKLNANGTLEQPSLFNSESIVDCSIRDGHYPDPDSCRGFIKCAQVR